MASGSVSCRCILLLFFVCLAFCCMKYRERLLIVVCCIADIAVSPFFASFFSPLSGVKMAEGNGSCFGGAGQLPEGLLLLCTQVGGQEWRCPSPRDCVALLIVVFCWLLLLVVVVVAPVSGVGCWALLFAVVSFVLCLNCRTNY